MIHPTPNRSGIVTDALLLAGRRVDSLARKESTAHAGGLRYGRLGSLRDAKQPAGSATGDHASIPKTL